MAVDKVQYVHALGDSRPKSEFDKWYGGNTVGALFVYLLNVALFGLYCVDVLTLRKLQ